MKSKTWEKFCHFVWGVRPSTREESKLLLKIDWFILSYCCLMVCLVACNNVDTSCWRGSSILQTVSLGHKASHERSRATPAQDPPRGLLRESPWNWCCWADLDRSNISNAYVSGMREELNMMGTDFNVSSLRSSDEEVSVRSLTRFTENQHHFYLWLYHWHGT